MHDSNSLGVEKNAFSQRGFAGINMCADSYVSYASQVPNQSRNLFLKIYSEQRMLPDVSSARLPIGPDSDTSSLPSCQSKTQNTFYLLDFQLLANGFTTIPAFEEQSIQHCAHSAVSFSSYTGDETHKRRFVSQLRQLLIDLPTMMHAERDYLNQRVRPFHLPILILDHRKQAHQ
jgi:hypothetical protein